MDNQMAQEEPKQKRRVGMVSVKTILKNPRRYGFVDNDHAHRYAQGMSRDALIQVNTISDVDKGLVHADHAGANKTNDVQNQNGGESGVEQRTAVDQLSASGIQGSLSDKAAGKQPARFSSLSTQPISNQEHSCSSNHIHNPSIIRGEATQPQRRTPPPRLLHEGQPIAPKDSSIPARNESEPSQKKGSWRDPPTAADDPDDPLSKFYATGSYTINSRAAYSLSNISYTPRGQPDVMDLGSRILAKMSLVPQTKVFPRQAAVQPTQAAPATSSFGQPATGAHPPPANPMTAPLTVTAGPAVSAPSQPGTAPSGQQSLPLFQPPIMNAAISASSANYQANSGVSTQLSQHLSQLQANAGPSTNIPISTRPAPDHHAMPHSIARTVPSTNAVNSPVSVSSASGLQPTSDARQVNTHQANTLTWLTPVGPSSFAAMQPPVRPTTSAPSQTTASSSANLGRPLPAPSSGRIVTPPSIHASTDSGRPLPTSTSIEVVTAAPATNASTESDHLDPASNYKRLAAAIALHKSTNSARHLPASSSRSLATASAMDDLAQASTVSRRPSATPLPASSSIVSNAAQTAVPRSSLSSRQPSSSSPVKPNTAPQLNTLVPEASALSPANRVAMLTADYAQEAAPTPPNQTEPGVDAMDIDDQDKVQEIVRNLFLKLEKEG
ncbi:hypothetical protein BDV97DRAFT_396793 [Delphinella strobiligena]|nr:hypothetical protein BDV97DRAFT_396793 [Delphinella strobiligena]